VLSRNQISAIQLPIDDNTVSLSPREEFPDSPIKEAIYLRHKVLRRT